MRFYREMFEIFVLIGGKYVDISAFISFGNIVLNPHSKWTNEVERMRQACLYNLANSVRICALFLIQIL